MLLASFVFSSDLFVLKRIPLLKTGMLILAAASVATVVLMVYSARPWGGNSSYTSLSDYACLFGFLAWALSPYLFIAVLLSRYHENRRCRVPVLTGAGLIAVSGVAILIDSLFVHIDAQGALAFLFLPLYQWIAALVLAFICKGVAIRDTQEM